MARWLIILGIALVVLGLLWPLLQKSGLGRLPGAILILRPKLFIVWHGLVDLEQFLHTLKRIAGKVCAGGDSRNGQGWPDSKATLEDALCEMRDALEYAYDRWQPHEVGGLKGSLPAMDAAM